MEFLILCYVDSVYNAAITIVQFQNDLDDALSLNCRIRRNASNRNILTIVSGNKMKLKSYTLDLSLSTLGWTISK